MDALIRGLAGLTLNQARQALAYAVLEDGRLTVDDLQHIVDRKAQLIHDGGLLEFYPLEENRFEIGGFAALRTWLDRVHVGFEAAARAVNLPPPRGILLVGIQGCGKSLAAKYVARCWRMPLLKLDAGRLYDKYIGESEKNLHRVTGLAESMAPAVLWIDEIEKGFAQGGAEADGGVSQRLLASFLTWLQERKAQVFIVATANDFDALPPELLRKGRFDEIFFVDLPDAAERDTIIRIHLRLRRQDPDRVDLGAVVAATGGFSGAEIEQAVIGALYRALHDQQALSTSLLLDEVRATVPLSVTRHEDVERLRAMAKGRFVPVK
jgi:SpoVK/Ycf46/Vps4 family AAA+-type ATPase